MKIVPTLSRQLVGAFGAGFSPRNLRHMMKFAESFSDEEIVAAEQRQLGWSHCKEIAYLKDRDQPWDSRSALQDPPLPARDA